MSGPSYQLLGHDLESPLLNAAGSINGNDVERIMREVTLLSRTAIGGITLGSFTVPQQDGNEAKYGPPVYDYNPERKETTNSMGLPNVGSSGAEGLLEEARKRIHGAGKIVIASISPTLNAPENGGNSYQQSDQLVTRLLQRADIVEVNLSCPNVVTEDAGRKPILGYDVAAVDQMVDVLDRSVGRGQQLMAKMPPYRSFEEQRAQKDIAKVFLEKPVFRAVVTSNTIPGHIPRDPTGKPKLSVPGGAGGLSGPATAPIGRANVSLWKEQLGDAMTIVSAEGVHDGRELLIRRQLGAVAGEGVTFLWESRDWGNAISTMLDDFTHFETIAIGSRR